MDPIEGRDGELNPLQNRVSVDNQTDISSSNYAEGVKSDIAKGDEKLGKEINQVQSEQKQMFDELNSIKLKPPKAAVI